MRFAAAAVLAALLSLAPTAAAQPDLEHYLIEDIALRDQLIADQENLLNAYRCMFSVDVSAVRGGCDSPESVVPGSVPENPTQEDISARNGLIVAQEDLLNVYRCRFSIDTQLVPEGCAGESGIVTAVCPDSYSGAGQEFQYNPSDYQSDPALTAFEEAVEQLCGQWCGEFCGGDGGQGVCPPDTLNRGETYEYSGGLDEGGAIALYCGRTAADINSLCEVIDNESTGAILDDSPNVRGDCFIMGIHVQQFDERTGPCRFLGSFSDSRDSSFNSATLSLFEFTTPGTTPPCTALAGAEEGGNIVIAATYWRIYTYNTAEGGTNSVPYFKLEGVSGQ